MADTKILIADDDDSIRFVLQKFLERTDFVVDVAENGRETLELFQLQTYAVVFLDVIMPDANGLDLLNDLKAIDETTSVVIITAHGDTQTAIEAAKRSAYDYITKPFDRKALVEVAIRAANASEHARSTLLQHETVLIIGESGAGKELVAKAIHENSSRANEEFVVVDCSAIPSALIESALFGHVKGAYTGADNARQGKFEQAGKGTIFLDEVGELPQEIQLKLLRVLVESSKKIFAHVLPLSKDSFSRDRFMYCLNSSASRRMTCSSSAERLSRSSK